MEETADNYYIEEAEREKELRRQKTSARSRLSSLKSAAKSGSFNSAQKQDRAIFKKKKGQDDGEKVKRDDAGPLSPRRGTNMLLRYAWRSLATVWVFLLIGLPYVNFHVLMHLPFPQVFGPLGDEWVPPAYKALAGEFGQMGRGIGLLEKVALVVLDLAVLFIIGAAILIFLFVLDFTENFFELLMDYMRFLISRIVSGSSGTNG